MVLSSQSKGILELLVRHIKQGAFKKSSNPKLYLTYQYVHDSMNFSMMAPTAQKSLDIQGLDKLNKWLKLKRLPAITSIIINPSTRYPADSFFKVYERPGDFQWWLKEVAKTLEFNWEEYLNQD